MDYIELFRSICPGFFDRPGIKNLPAEHVFAEMEMPLQNGMPAMPPVPCPEEITFGEYGGDVQPLKEAVSLVDGGWVQYFGEGGRYFCAFDGKRIVAFCALTDFGCYQNLRIGGPGCVGTVPEYRKRGIGLEMVRRATLILKQDGYDLSWIHYTHIADWYAKLGYRTVVRWNCGGVL